MFNCSMKRTRIFNEAQTFFVLDYQNYKFTPVRIDTIYYTQWYVVCYTLYI